LPNAGIPLVTAIGLEVPRLLAGAMVTEVVFAWPGLGRLLTQSLLSRDYPVAMGVLMMLATAVVAANLLTDLAYHWIDPRVRVR
jgi:peptide/nickel transport system permease protein